MSFQFGDSQGAAFVPLHRYSQVGRHHVEVGAEVARVENQCLDIGRNHDRPVDLRLDVGIEDATLASFDRIRALSGIECIDKGGEGEPVRLAKWEGSKTE